MAWERRATLIHSAGLRCLEITTRIGRHGESQLRAIVWLLNTLPPSVEEVKLAITCDSFSPEWVRELPWAALDSPIGRRSVKKVLFQILGSRGHEGDLELDVKETLAASIVAQLPGLKDILQVQIAEDS